MKSVIGLARGRQASGLALVVVAAFGPVTTCRAGFAVAAGPAKARWAIRDLGTLGGRLGAHSDAVAVNDRGQVIGNSRGKGGEHAFLWQRGRMSDLGTLAGRYGKSSFSEAVAINDHAQVIGNSGTNRFHQHAFLWQNGRIIDLGTLGGRFGAYSEAIAINERGQIIGNSYGQDGLSSHAFLWEHGRMIDLGTLPGKVFTTSSAVAINDLGQVIGESSPSACCQSRAFLWQHGRMSDLAVGADPIRDVAAINDRGQIAAVCRHYVACLWQAGQTTDLGQAKGDHRYASPVFLNERGDVIGNCVSKARDAVHACLWEHGAALDLGTFGGAFGRAFDVNAHEQVVGRATVGPPTGKAHAFVWQNRRLTDLGGLHATDWSEAVAINDSGQIVGNSRPDEHSDGYAVLWVPAATHR